MGKIPQRQLEKLKKEAAADGRGSFVYARILDKTKVEQKGGVTIETTAKEFFTPSYHYTIIDAPGHRDFIKNMISGASQADVALLMVPANKGAFETSIAKGNHKRKEIQGQTRQHARLCHLLGIDQIIVAINKMDEKSVMWDEERYMEIRNEVEKMLSKIGYKTKKIPFIPISGWKGDNLMVKSTNMDWYKGFEVTVKKEKVKGFTLYDAFESVVHVPKRASNKPFRMPVSGLLKIPGVGDVICGRIEQGILKPKMEVKFCPTGCTGKVFSMEVHNKSVDVAGPGDNIGINIRKLPQNNMPRVGDVMFINTETGTDTEPRPVEVFTATVHVQKECTTGKLKAATRDPKTGGWKGGFSPNCHIRTAKAPCMLIAINWKMGTSTNQQKVPNPSFIEPGDQAEVVFKPKKPIYLEAYNQCKPLGRVAAMDSNSLIMLGRVTQVTNKDYKC